jgi:hypothetical protein
MRRPAAVLGARRCAAAHAAAWTAALLAALGAASPARAQSGTPPLNGGRVAAQVALGALGTPVGFLGGGVLTKWLVRHLGARDETASSAAYVGAWTGAALATAAGPTLIGSHGRVTGSYLAALGGAVAGGAGSYLLVRVNDRGPDDDRPCRLRCAAAAAGVFLLPSIGATVGFNLSRRYER